MLDRTSAPDFKTVGHIDLIQPRNIKFSNGVNLFYFDSPEQELIRIELVFGNLKFDQEKPLLNQAVMAMLTEGTGKLTAAEIADQIDFYGAFLQADFGFDQSQLTVYSLNRHLPKVLPVVKDIVTDSVFPEKELETYIRNQQQKLQVSLKKNDVVARRVFNRAMHGSTLYGFAAKAENYQQLKQADLLAHFKLMFQPANCTIIAAGKVDEETIKLLEATFGNDWTDSAYTADTTQPTLHPFDEHFYYVEKPDALQSAIRVGLRTINRPHPDFPALQVLNTVLGGYFGSRLMANIREDKGYTYGIGSGITSLKHCGSIFIASEVGADVCKAALAEVEKEINTLREELIPEEELELVRNYMLGSLLGSLENIFSHADKFKNIYYSGLGFEYYERYVEIVKTVTAEELKRLANEYLDYSKMYKVIVGKY
ncbi:insulinase family protein [Mucilaginibacter sp. RS28]|uniref:Insulinase family protein n=1 Tax=Mucilaginibacter straminoryzae TaxID=2932774 RepID=A0A9X2BB80_9SPHI|nr:pitrilysin family protein [Mucilaginibacter straminoryzae]MCJ8211530.1 insulinase family protein [Mucilaginibacter straminoryzae]